MSYKAHRNGDSRSCGAKTTVVLQSTVYVNGKLWAVEGDPNDHTAGALVATGTTVSIEGYLVICHTPDNAQPDVLCYIVDGEHCNPKTAQGSDNVWGY